MQLQTVLCYTYIFYNLIFKIEQKFYVAPGSAPPPPPPVKNSECVPVLHQAFWH
jgi:hypothetical protein